jgi:1-deoxy-D-xylulose-5-phosphate synthase
VEDNVIQGGFGSAVLEAYSRMGITDLTVKLHSLPDTFVEHGTPSELYRMLRLDAAGIAGVASEFVKTRDTVTR